MNFGQLFHLFPFLCALIGNHRDYFFGAVGERGEPHSMLPTP